MKNIVTAVKTTCMWIALIVIGVSLANFVLSTSVWFLGLLLLTPVKGLGYIAAAWIIGIGIFHMIDKVQE